MDGIEGFFENSRHETIDRAKNLGLEYGAARDLFIDNYEKVNEKFLISGSWDII
jgi:hypothetical protein